MQSGGIWQQTVHYASHRQLGHGLQISRRFLTPRCIRVRPGAGAGDPVLAEEAMRRRLAAAHHPLHPLPLPHPAPPPPPSQEPDSEPESSCSDSGPAFRHAAPSPAEDSPTAPGPSGQQPGGGGSDYPSPNISVGPPIHPPPHLLPYLYPHSLYPGASGGHPLLGPGHPLSLFGAAAAHHSVSPGLLAFNTLALAQHPFFNHAAAYSAAASAGLGPHHHTSHSLKVHRFAPYSLPVTPTPHSLVSPLGSGSAFETVTPGATSPSLHPVTSPPPPPSPESSPKPDSSELKSIEKMVNGLEVKAQNHHHVKCEESSGGK